MKDLYGSINYVIKGTRGFLRMTNNNYPLAVRMAFHDAMSFNGQTGGAKANFKYRSFSRRPENKEFVHPFNEMIFFKQTLDHPMDRVTLADFIQYSALYSIMAAQGPRMWEKMSLGRVETSLEGDSDSATSQGKCPLPSHGATAYRDRFYANGFNDEEMVALSYVFAFGNDSSLVHSQLSNYAVFSNAYYKQLKSGSPS